MNKFLQIGFAFGLCFMLTTEAKADLLVEPYIGYQTGTFEQTLDGFGAPFDGETDFKSTGTAYGLRLGYQFLGFMVGFEHYLESLKDEDDDAINISNTGAFIGYNLPVMFRVWASYIPQSKFTNVKDDEPELTGSATKLGVGFTGLPFVSINLEFIKGAYGIEDFEVDDSEIEGSSSATMLSVSLPLDI